MHSSLQEKRNDNVNIFFVIAYHFIFNHTHIYIYTENSEKEFEAIMNKLEEVDLNDIWYCECLYEVVLELSDGISACEKRGESRRD